LAAALAASLVLIVGLSNRQPLPVVPMKQPAESTSVVASRPVASETDNLQARMAPAGNGPAESVGQQAAPAAPLQSADAEAAASTKSEAKQNEVAGIVSQPVSQLADVQEQSAAATGSGAVESGESRGAPLAKRELAPFGIKQPVTALLIVDPKLVPTSLKQEDYATGELLARLGDARRLAGDRPIAALVTLQLGDRTADAAVIAGAVDEPQMLRRDLDKTAAPSASPTSAGDGYDVILLDRR
jgi:hypothetical protein